MKLEITLPSLALELLNRRGGHKMKAHNPILPGFYPDPSICRVGEDYYLVNTVEYLLNAKISPVILLRRRTFLMFSAIRGLWNRCLII